MLSMEYSFFSISALLILKLKTSLQNANEVIQIWSLKYQFAKVTIHRPLHAVVPHTFLPCHIFLVWRFTLSVHFSQH